MENADLVCVVCGVIMGTKVLTTPIDLFSCGFVMGALCARDGSMPYLCEPHRARLFAIARSHGIALVMCKTDAEGMAEAIRIVRTFQR